MKVTHTFPRPTRRQRLNTWTSHAFDAAGFLTLTFAVLACLLLIVYLGLTLLFQPAGWLTGMRICVVTFGAIAVAAAGVFAAALHIGRGLDQQAEQNH